MIDIHSHLIPKFDDGPKSFEESLRMLREAEAQGIKDVFATSHFNEYIPRKLEEEYFTKLQKLREEALSQNIKVNIYSGSEIFYHHYMPETIKSSRVTSLGGWGQYILLEFPMFRMPEGVEEVLFQISVDNYIPIVAHPERYHVVIDKPQRALKYIQHGGLLQINGGSVLGLFGKSIQKVSLDLLDRQLVHFIASDAHSPDNRNFLLRDVYEYLKDRLPREYLEDIFYSNPRAIIDEVRIDEVNMPVQNEPTGFLNWIKKRLKAAF